MRRRERGLPPGWYPFDAAGCREEIAEFLATPAEGVVEGIARHGIVPHAGWGYSGRAAAHVFAAVAESGAAPEVVLVYGGHLGSSERPVVYDYDLWESPMGELPIDTELTAAVARAADARPEGGRGDNTVEVQVPMVQHFFPDARLVAVHAPNGPGAIELANIVVREAGALGRTVATFGAADLTHYGAAYGFAPKGHGPEAVAWVKDDNDREILDLTLKMDARGALESADRRNNCCSSGAVAAAITTAAAQGAGRATLLDYYTSYDVQPGRNVVGYMGVAFSEG
ncbi:MAG: AmmeMemoRadiSam system protein B [Deltaproteobacteria bacterium]|jgi:AmmeMemoRadiSam system protein B|nr:AmmeMemoRadiSam system protein B [Deltaproteobacteria bacterium]MBW2532316.1 AmmeMemoRadiSam system protein B [Deltaproteobacteria bacterium]